MRLDDLSRGSASIRTDRRAHFIHHALMAALLSDTTTETAARGLNAQSVFKLDVQDPASLLAATLAYMLDSNVDREASLTLVCDIFKNLQKVQNNPVWEPLRAFKWGMKVKGFLLIMRHFFFDVLGFHDDDDDESSYCGCWFLIVVVRADHHAKPFSFFVYFSSRFFFFSPHRKCRWVTWPLQQEASICCAR